MLKKVIISIVAVAVIGGGAAATYFLVTKNSDKNDKNQNQTQENKDSRKKREMMGQNSFGLAVCEEVSKDIVSQAIGKPIEETEDYSTGSETGCKYYTNKAKLENALIVVGYLSVENQKKGQEFLGRKLTTNDKIPMEHFIALQEDGVTINAIYLVMAPQKFVRVDRTSTNVATNDQMIDLASKVSDIIMYE